MRSLWFPVSMALILLVGLAGIVAAMMGVFGSGPDLGPLTSSWRLPGWTAGVVVLLPLLLLLLYFLKLKRRAVAVPSTFLWRKTIEDAHVNAFIQWLRRNLLLLLQLLTLFVFLFALLALQLEGETSTGKYHILMIDNSASMAATDVNPTRLDEARDKALAKIDNLHEGDAAMVIAFNSRAEVLQSFTTDRSLLRKAVRSIQLTQATTRIDEALLQADGRANPMRTTDDESIRPPGEQPGKARTYVPPEESQTEVHLFSDGGFPDVSDFAMGNLTMRYHRIGNVELTENVGIVSIRAERDEKDPKLLRVLARVMNFRGKTERVRLQLEVKVDGKTRDLLERRLVLPGRKSKADDDSPGEENALFRLQDVRQRANVVLHAKLLDTKDVFPLDDEAWLVVGAVRKCRIAVIGPTTNAVLEAFLSELEKQGTASVEYLKKSDLDKEDYRKNARAGAWDLVLFDRCSPATVDDMPQCNAFFIDALPPPWDRGKMKAVKSPRVRGWATTHSLMRGLTGLQDVAIADAFLFDLRDPNVPGKPPRLLETDKEGALMFTLRRHPFTDLVMTFAIVDGSGRWNTFWPLHLSFPLFMKNVVFQLGNIESDDSTQPGQVKRLRAENNVDRIDIVDPTGRSFKLNRGGRADFVFDRADRVGIYEVNKDGETMRSFAVNLFDSNESDLKPRGEFKIGAERVVAGETGRRTRELWKWLAVIAFMLLLVEWVIYNRRAVI